MSSDKEKRTHEAALKYIRKYMKFVDKVDDGLMKAHEFVGHAGDVAVDLAVAAQGKVMSLSEALGRYRDEVWEAVAKDERKVYGSAPTTTADQFTNLFESRTKDVRSMSREEKIAFIIDGYGLANSEVQVNKLKESNDQSLDLAVRMIQNRYKYRGQ